MKTEAEINHIVKNTITDILGLDYTGREELTTTTDIVSRFGADSLAIVEITIATIRNTGVDLTVKQEDALWDAFTKTPTIETITKFIMNGTMVTPPVIEKKPAPNIQVEKTVSTEKQQTAVNNIIKTIWNRKNQKGK